MPALADTHAHLSHYDADQLVLQGLPCRLGFILNVGTGAHFPLSGRHVQAGAVGGGEVHPITQTGYGHSAGSCHITSNRASWPSEKRALTITGTAPRELQLNPSKSTCAWHPNKPVIITAGRRIPPSWSSCGRTAPAKGASCIVFGQCRGKSFP